MDLQAMKAGRERARKRRTAEAVRLVRDWRAWLLAGSPKGRMPAVMPRDADYAMARAAGEPLSLWDVAA